MRQAEDQQQSFPFRELMNSSSRKSESAVLSTSSAEMSSSSSSSGSGVRQSSRIPSSAAAAAAAESRASPAAHVLPVPPSISVSAAKREEQFDAKSRWNSAVARVSEVLKAELVDDLTSYVYELQSELAANVQLIESMLTAQEQLGSEAQAQLRQLADVAAARILTAESAQQTWRRRAHKMRNSAEALKCVICLERARNVVLKPCSHLALCSECTAQAVNTATCPMCRVASTGIDIVFIP